MNLTQSITVQDIDSIEVFEPQTLQKTGDHLRQIVVKDVKGERFTFNLIARTARGVSIIPVTVKGGGKTV